jgi:hypothetical protein
VVVRRHWERLQVREIARPLADCYLVLDPGSAMELRVAGTGLDRL